MRSPLLMIAILVSACCWLQAAEPEVKLPPNGTWTKYRKMVRNSAGTEISSTLMIRLLAGLDENGERSRWLEFEWLPDGKNDERELDKYLILEKALLNDPAPIRSALRSWHQNGVKEPHKRDRAAEGANPYWFESFISGPCLVCLPVVRDGLESHTVSRTVPFQRGELQCKSALKGVPHSDRRLVSASAKEIQATESTVWLHPDIPFGFASASFRLSTQQVDDAGNVSKPRQLAAMEFTVLDSGDKAESAIPDAK